MGLPEHLLAVLLVTWPSVVIVASGARRPVAAVPSPAAAKLHIDRVAIRMAERRDARQHAEQAR